MLKYYIMTEVCYNKGGLETCSEITNTFSINVDWELDYFGGGECHGSEWVTDRDIVEMEFTQLQNGDLFVEFGPQKTLFLQSKDGANQYCWKTKRVKESIECQESKFVPGGYDIGWVDAGAAAAYTTTSAFVACYRESASLNSELTPAQKAIVNDFFEKALSAVASR